LLSASLSPCRRYHPAGVSSKLRSACSLLMVPSTMTKRLGLQSSFISRLPMRLLALRPGDSLTTPRVALSMGFRSSISLLPAIQAKRLLTTTLGRLTLPERASLRWTHSPAERLLCTNQLEVVDPSDAYLF
jgi:hypothetical protein